MSNKTDIQYNRHKMKPRYRKNLVLTAIVGCLTWGLTARGLTVHFKYGRGFEEISYKKMLLLPLRMEEHRKEMGEFYIKEGFRKLDSGEFQNGFDWIRMGLIRSPKNFEARLFIAQAYIHGLKRIDEGVEIFESGLEHIKNTTEELQHVFRILMSLGLHEKIIEIAQSLKGQAPDALLDLVTAETYMNLGELEKVKQLIQSQSIAATPEASVLNVLVEFEEGDPRKAYQELQAIHLKHPKLSFVLKELVRASLAMNDTDAALEYATKRITLDKANVDTYLDRLEVAYAQSNYSDIKTISRLIMESFAKNELALKLLAQISAEKSNIAVVERLYEKALEENQDAGHYGICLIRCYYNQCEFLKARAITSEYLDENSDWIGTYGSEFYGLKSLIAMSLGDQELCDEFFKKSLEFFRPGFSQLETIGELFEVNQEMEKAYLAYKKVYDEGGLNIRLLIKLIRNERIREDLDNLTTDLKTVLKNQYQIDTHELAKIYTLLTSDTHIHKPEIIELIKQIENKI
jgi:tetratricopeptide (TPR) repeat protein